MVLLNDSIQKNTVVNFCEEVIRRTDEKVLEKKSLSETDQTDEQDQKIP